MNLYLENTGKGILITFLLLIGSMLYAQNNSKITIKKKNISLQTALADIREQTKMSVSYNSSQLPKTRISLDINNQSLDQALKTNDPAEKTRLYKAAQDIIWQESPWIPLVVEKLVSAHSKNLTGFWIMPDTGFSFEDADLQ